MSLQTFAQQASSVFKTEVQSAGELLSATEHSLNEVLSKPVKPGLIGPLLGISTISVVLFFLATSCCLQQSRDSNIALNSKALQRQYYRNMALDCMINEL